MISSHKAIPKIIQNTVLIINSFKMIRQKVVFRLTELALPAGRLALLEIAAVRDSLERIKMMLRDIES